MRLRVLGGRAIVLSLVSCFAVASAFAAGAGPVTVYSSKQTTVLGKVLVSGSGRTLYHYKLDGKNAAKCTGACTAKWPPLLIGAGASPIAGPGATSSLLGTVKRSDGKVQVTYRGWPLYLFAGDKGARQTKGQAFEKEWYVVNTNGALVKHAVAATPTTTAAPTTTSGYPAWG